jgi:HSP20 family protein
MANEHEQSSATQPATRQEQSSATRAANKQEERSSQGTGQASGQGTGQGTGQGAGQGTGLARSRGDDAISRRRQSGQMGLPLTAFDMLRMTPFSLFRRMTEEFDRALQPLLSEDQASGSIAWTPRVEVSEQDQTYRILAELPGLSPNDVRVEVEDDALVLQGERQVEREGNEGGIRRSERQFGFFYRRIPLPEGAKPEEAKAKFHDGILEITVPAPDQQTKRRQIQIEADSKSSSNETKQAA